MNIEEQIITLNEKFDKELEGYEPFTYTTSGTYSSVAIWNENNEIIAIDDVEDNPFDSIPIMKKSIKKEINKLRKFLNKLEKTIK